MGEVQIEMEGSASPSKERSFGRRKKADEFYFNPKYDQDDFIFPPEGSTEGKMLPSEFEDFMTDNPITIQEALPMFTSLLKSVGMFHFSWFVSLPRTAKSYCLP